MHVFKRFYLLFSVLIAFGIPLISFIQYVEVSPNEFILIEPALIQTLDQELPFKPHLEQSNEKTSYTIPILWTIYGLGLFLFGFRFIKNLRSIYLETRRNINVRSGKFTHVLLQDLVIPHTFLNYIFLNKQKYKAHLIPKEVLLHEHTHAKQKHTLDILYIEILQLLFWFHPLFYFIKKAIKLNHEFLADSAVLNKGFTLTTYQQILLAFSSTSQSNQISNAINYASLKKRFTLMKTQTSQKIVWFKSLILLPILAVLIYSFSTRVIAQKEDSMPNESTTANNYPLKDITIRINNQHQILLNNKKVVLLKNIAFEVKKIINNYPLEQLENTKVHIEVQENVHTGLVTDLKIELRKTGLNFVEISTNGQYIKYNLNQQGATSKQLAIYNKLAKKYNTQPKDRRIIKLKEINRLEYIYGVMTEDQKKNAEPFPECPPPPSIPVLKEGEDPQMLISKTFYNYKDQSGKEVHVEWAYDGFQLVPAIPPPPIPENATINQRKNYKIAMQKYEEIKKKCKKD